MKNTITRRKLLKIGFAGGLLLPVLGNSLLSCSSEKQETSTSEATKKLRILILGGTSFLGPHQIAYAISRGHSVTTFTRGKTTPTIYTELFEQVEQLIGDRENDLTALENGKWDVVIDNSGSREGWAEKTAELLKDKADLYMFTSSTGVYYPYLGDNIDETTEVLLKEPEVIENEDEKLEYWYGVMKATSEVAVSQAFGKDRSILVRPTYMIGPADQTDRFIYWPIRLAKGGEIMIPGKTEDPAQYIDVRDVAEWMIRLAEKRTTGTFNAVGPKAKQTMPEFVQEANEAFDVKSEFVQITDYEFLKASGVPYLVPWIMPEGKNYGSSRVNNEKAIANGLTFRPLTESVKDIHAWWYSDAVTEEKRQEYENGPDSLLMREADILEKWESLKS